MTRTRVPWGYGYDGYGEQTSVTNARGQTITTDYDALGRKTAEHDPADAGGRLSTWTYDTADYGIGQVASETVQEDVNAGGDPTVTVYQRIYGYDSAGRATASEITVGGTTYLQGAGYDEYGRPAVRAYPAMGGGEDQAPTVSAEADPPGPVASGSAVSLIASGSDPDGWGLSYHWEQTGGPAATLTATPQTSHEGSFEVDWNDVAGATSYTLKEDGPGDPTYYNGLSGSHKSVTGRGVGT